MNSTALYGIAAFADGYAVFWNGRYDETRYATREAAISELAKRDRAEQPRQPTPCQQQQANSAHTPGPWTATGLRVSDAKGQLVAQARLIADVATANEEGHNARLIAAAPDLVAALRDIAERPLADCDYDVISELNRIIGVAAAALAKVQQ
jgi:hypothetical protein